MGPLFISFYAEKGVFIISFVGRHQRPNLPPAIPFSVSSVCPLPSAVPGSPIPLSSMEFHRFICSSAPPVAFSTIVIVVVAVVALRSALRLMQPSPRSQMTPDCQSPSSAYMCHLPAYRCSGCWVGWNEDGECIGGIGRRRCLLASLSSTEAISFIFWSYEKYGLI